MDIFDTVLRLVSTAIGSHPAPPERRGCAIVMHPAQYQELCASQRCPKDKKPLVIDGLPIWLHDGLVGPAVVDRRTLNLLMMIGAVKV